MTRGIYILANDRTIDNAIALLNSIRAYDSNTPIIMVPYDKRYKTIAEILKNSYGVQIFENLQLLKRLSKNINKIFGRGFFIKPNMFRKQACWLGPFDEFLYIDTDMVVFEKIIDNLKYLSDYDFVCCDSQYSNGVKYIFKSKVLEDRIFTEEDLKDVFNAGFWGSKKGLISEDNLYKILEECAYHKEYLDFSEGVVDMPIMNYLVLKQISRRINLARMPSKGPRSWAGTPGFEIQGNRLFDPDVNMPLKYLHWAGIRIERGCPYWDIWRYYRCLNKVLKFPLN